MRENDETLELGPRSQKARKLEYDFLFPKIFYAPKIGPIASLNAALP